MKLFKIERTLQRIFFGLAPVREWQHRLRRRFFFERRAQEIWHYHGATDLALSLLSRIDRDSLWRDLPQGALVYIACLCERSMRKEAEAALAKFRKSNGDDMLWKILPVASFAESCGVGTELVRRSAALHRLIEENSRDFERLVAGKTVSVVGNAPTEIGSGNGPRIDSSDIVVRCNNFKLCGFEKDYGTKCDVWIKSFENDINHERSDIHPKLILYRSCTTHEILREPKLLDVIERDSRKTKISGISLADYTRARETLSDLPTTGYLALEKTLFLGDVISGLRVFGFSFLKGLSGPSFGLHYAEARSEKTAKTIVNGHNFGEEGEILREKLSKFEKLKK